MDLTKIDQPFGALDIETKLALCRAGYEGKVIECLRIADGKWSVVIDPTWFPDCTYRLQPEPLRDISLPWARKPIVPYTRMTAAAQSAYTPAAKRVLKRSISRKTSSS